MFKNFTNSVLETILNDKTNTKDKDNLKMIDSSNKEGLNFNDLTINEGRKQLISKTGENCLVETSDVFDYSKNEIIGVYLHGSISQNLASKAAVVILTTKKQIKEEDTQNLVNFAEQLGMQVVASKPKYLNKEDIPLDILENEKKILKEQIIKSNSDNKDEKVIDKILNSKLNNFIEDIVLNEQQFVIVDYDSKDNKLKVKDIVAKKAKSFNCEDLKILDFKFYY